MRKRHSRRALTFGSLLRKAAGGCLTGTNPPEKTPPLRNTLQHHNLQGGIKCFPTIHCLTYPPLLGPRVDPCVRDSAVERSAVGGAGAAAANLCSARRSALTSITSMPAAKARASRGVE